MVASPLPRSTPALSSTTGIRVLVADPHPVVRAGVRSLVAKQPDMRVVGEAADDDDTLRLATQLTPDLVILEPLLSGEGVQVVARLHQARPELKMLVLTRCEDGGTLPTLLSLGVCGYVRKSVSVEDLLLALRAVAGGGTFIDPALGKQLGRPARERIISKVE